jgi:hypothetical protein
MVPQMRRLIGFTLACVLLLTSCSFPLVRTIEVTRVVPQTVVVTKLLVIVETTTPGPSGAGKTFSTPNPFMVWTTQQVVEAFLTAGLEVNGARPMIFDDYGLVPMLAVEGTRFFIPSICPDCSGRIMSFANQEDLTIVENYYAQMASFGAVLFSWVFVKNNILVQINGELPEERARMYQAALENMK